MARIKSVQNPGSREALNYKFQSIRRIPKPALIRLVSYFTIQHIAVVVVSPIALRIQVSQAPTSIVFDEYALSWW
jgi:hypothetical protein